MKALMILPMMLAGLIVVVGMFALRVVGLIAALAAGFGLLATFGALAAYDHTPIATHWLALQQSGGSTAVCIAAVIVAWFVPMWLFRENTRHG